jgi:serine/threonine-protein phosphatase 2A regulatory subunit B
MAPPTGEGGGGDGDAFSFRTSSSSSSHAPEDSSGFLLSNEDRRNQRRKSSETTENIDFDGNENKKNTNNNNTFASALEEEEEEEEEERVGRRAEETATAMMMHSMREEEDKHNQHGVLRWSFSQVFGERAPNEEVQDADIISAVEFDRTGDWLATGDRGGRVVLFERVRQTKRASKQHPEDELEDVLMEEMSSEMQYNRDDQVGVMINNNDDNNNNNNNASTSGNHNTTNEQQKLGENGRNEYNTRPEQVEFRYLTEFQSHEPEFDYLKSLEIEEKINTLKWCHQGANEGRFVLSTNDKTIKLWKVFEKRAEAVSGFNRDSNDSINTTTTATHNWGGNTTSNRNNNSNNNNNNNNKGNAAGSTEYRLKIPRVLKGELGFNARCRRCYANAHAYHINSLSVNSDGETFISADDLRVNLWHLERSNGSFNIVDIKPENMEELTEVITSACFHPSHCQHFAYSSSKGTIRLADMRINASCNAASKSFEEPEPVEKRSFFSEIIASVSDVKFSKDGRYFLSRDYLTLKLWDVNMEKSPLATFNVHDHLRPRLCDLYEKDSIFDKFQCCIRGDGKYVASGSYNANLRCFNAFEPGSEGTTTEITSRMPPRRSESAFGNGGTTREDLFVAGAKTPPISLANSHHYQNLSDFSSNILHAAWHPEEDILACGVSNSLYIFNA